MRLVIRPSPCIVLSVQTTSGQMLGNADVESICLDLPPTAFALEVADLKLVTRAKQALAHAVLLAGGSTAILRLRKAEDD